MKYTIKGTDVVREHPWGGNGVKPYIMRVLEDGEVWANDNHRRGFFNYYPPDDDYVWGSDTMSAHMQSLSRLCEDNRLLDGDLQWHRYMEDDAYRKYIDDNALKWYDMLMECDSFWDGYKATEQYAMVRTAIHAEIAEHEAYLKAKEKRDKRARMRGDDGSARFEGRDIPRKIPCDDDAR